MIPGSCIITTSAFLFLFIAFFVLCLMVSHLIRMSKKKDEKTSQTSEDPVRLERARWDRLKAVHEFLDRMYESYPNDGQVHSFEAVDEDLNYHPLFYTVVDTNVSYKRNLRISTWSERILSGKDRGVLDIWYSCDNECRQINFYHLDEQYGYYDGDFHVTDWTHKPVDDSQLILDRLLANALNVSGGMNNDES